MLNQRLELWHEQHIDFLMRGIRHLGPSYSVLDANRPWLCYWILNSIAILGEPIDMELGQRTVDFLCRCQDVDGGYGGGPGQEFREKLLQFLIRMKDPSGGFRMHDAGEMDVRGCYTAIALERFHSLVYSCQTYEGGIAGEPGAEAHGGYTFCGLATLILINEAHRLDLPSLLGRVEGGFQGRTNKLVDGCYSFWQGGVFPLIQRLSELMHQQLRMSCVKAGQFDAKASTVQSEETKRSSMTRFTCSAGLRVVEEKNAQQSDDFVADSMLNEQSEARVMAEKIFPAIDCFCKTSLQIEAVEGEEDPACHSSLPSDSVQSSNDSGLTFLEKDIECGPLFNTHALQGYILLCSQVLEGGLRDKPGKFRDYYHTCYCLSGLSTAQYSWSRRVGAPPPPSAVLGPFTNLLEPVHPLFNVVLDRYYDAHRYYSSLH